MKTITLILFITVISNPIFGQNKLDGIYKGLIEISFIDSLGVKHNYGESFNSKYKWYHLSYLKIENDSAFLDMHPISITDKGDTLYSASDGGFYFFKGIFELEDELIIKLSEVTSDYCGKLVVKNEEGKLIPKKRRKTLRGKIEGKGINIAGQLFIIQDKDRYMESQHYKPETNN